MHGEQLDCGEFSQARGTAVFKRLAASCAFFFFIQVAATGRGPVRKVRRPVRKGRRRLSRICRLGRSSPPPRADASPRGDKCGSVAYTADGAFGAAYGMDNCDDAERLAVDECVRESTDKPDCSRGAVTKRDSWFYIQFCRQGSEWTTHVTTKQTLSGRQSGCRRVGAEVEVRQRATAASFPTAFCTPAVSIRRCSWRQREGSAAGRTLQRR